MDTEVWIPPVLKGNLDLNALRPTYRECRTCKKIYLLTAFSIDKDKLWSRSFRCKKCNRAACKRWTEVNRTSKQAADREYYAKNRSRIQSNNRLWKSQNHDRHIFLNDRWRRANSEKIREYRNRRRARLLNVPHVEFTLEELYAKLRYWGFKCWVCDGDYDSLDHVKPLIAGGAHMLCNLRPICRRCNSSKKDQWPYGH